MFNYKKSIGSLITLMAHYKWYNNQYPQYDKLHFLLFYLSINEGVKHKYEGVWAIKTHIQQAIEIGIGYELRQYELNQEANNDS